MNAAPPVAESAPAKPAAGPPDWKNFRDHLATADKDGRRRWIYARKPNGRFYRWRTGVSLLLLGVLFAGPFIKINGNPLLMLNIVARRFSIMGRIFWPQDMALFAIALLLFFTGIMVFTAAYGRIWCGWLCPQTLFMEMVFRRVEYWMEGDSRAQRTLAAAPWTTGKVLRKAGKQIVFFGLSFVISNLLLAYIIGADQLYTIVSDSPSRHLAGLMSLLAFTGVFYAIFARFREQACTFICPYGRLQSTVLDDNTVLVAYDYKRGEPRVAGGKTLSHTARRDAGRGDCVDCHLCVSVCPTGIDIRDGIQMECVNCTACIDACDNVMTRLDRPRGLIRYASNNNIERGETFRITPRLIGYGGIVTILASLFLYLVLTRPNIEAALLRAPGSLFEQAADGNLVNLYTLQLVNKTSRPMPVELRLDDVPGKLSIMGESQPVVPAEQLAETSVLIELAPGLLRNGAKKINVGVYSEGKRVQTVHTTFIGPRN